MRKPVLVLAFLALIAALYLVCFEQRAEAPGIAPAVIASEPSAATTPVPESAQREVASAQPVVPERTIIKLERPNDLLAPSTETGLWLKVIEKDGGAPIGAARAWDKNGQLGLTDDRGLTFVRAARAPGRYVSVSKDGCATALAKAIEGHDQPERALVVALAKSAALVVSLTRESLAPIERANVTLLVWNDHLVQPAELPLGQRVLIDETSFRAKTDAQGRAEIVDLPPNVPLRPRASLGKERLIVPGEPLVLSPGERREVAWKAGAGAVIEGRALEIDGSPAKATSIILDPALRNVPTMLSPYGPSRRTTKTDDDGRFRFIGMQPGRYWVAPEPTYRAGREPRPDEPAPLALVVEVPPDALSVDVLVHVERGLWIRGRVVDPAGKPSAMTAVHGDLVDRKIAAVTNVDEHGDFAFGPIVRGTWELWAGGTRGFAPSPRVRVLAGSEGIELRLSIGGEMAGLVVTGATQKAAFASVVLCPRDPKSMGTRLGGSKEDGTFAFEALEPDTYDVCASGLSGDAALAEGIVVTAGTKISGVRLVLEPAASITIHYDGPKSAAFCTLKRGAATLNMDGVEKGVPRRFTVPPGKIDVVVRVFDDGREDRRTVDLAAGDARELAFGSVK